MKLHQTTTKQGLAAELIVELLAAGPMRPCEIRAEAERRGLDFDTATWERARRRLGVESNGTGRRWYWSLPGSLADEIADLIAGCERRLAIQVEFDQYLAERDASGLLAEIDGGQLALL